MVDATHVLAPEAHTADLGYSIASGYVEITPEEPLPLAGYSRRHHAFEGIADPLEANVLLLRCGDSIAAFVSMDLLYVGNELRERIAARLAGRIPTEALFVSATHTHFAPATDRLLPRLGATAPAYLEMIVDHVCDMLERLLEVVPSPAAMRYATGVADHAINRRLATFALRRDFPFLKTRWEMRPNFSGPRDETIRVLSILDGNGARLAICWSYACHPVCFPQHDRVSADFPGVVRRILREIYGALPILYWQGFSGDVRPCCIATPKPAILGWRSPPAFGRFTQDQWNRWSGTLGERVAETAALTGCGISGNITCRRWSLSLEQLGLVAPGRSLTVQEVTFGDVLSIVGISAELVSEYIAPLISSRAPMDVIPIGCIDGVPGYVPTDAMVVQGGYEAKGFMPLFCVSGRYRSNVSEIITRRLFYPPTR